VWHSDAVDQHLNRKTTAIFKERADDVWEFRLSNFGLERSSAAVPELTPGSYIGHPDFYRRDDFSAMALLAELRLEDFFF
jgi:hypothetical protein